MFYLERRISMKNLTEGNEAKHIIMFALPMLLGNFFQTLYNVVDSIFVGKGIGSDALAAVNASFPIIFMSVALVMGLTMGSTILIAQFFGAKDINNVKKTINNAYFLLGLGSVLITIFGLIMSKTLLSLMNTPKEVFDDALVYLRIIFIGISFMFGYNSISAILRGLGDSITPVYFLVISTFINIVLDWMFIYSFRWGVAGAAYATIISQGVSFIIGIIYLNSKHDIFKIRLNDIRPDKKILGLTIKIGLPMAIQQTLVSIAMASLNRIINGFGKDALAAFGATGKIDSFLSMPAMSIAASASTFTGQNLGAGKVDRVKNGYKYAMLIGLMVTVTSSILIIIFRKQLIYVFTTNQEVIRLGAEYLKIIGVFYVFFALMFISNGIIRGSGDTLPTLIFTLFALWFIRVPLAVVLSKKIGLSGVWWAIGIGWMAGFILSIIYYFTGRWIEKSVIGKPQPKLEG